MARPGRGPGPEALIEDPSSRFLPVWQTKPLLKREPRALAWAKVDDVIVVPKLPMDRRHNSKIDYAALTTLLARR